MPTIKATCLGPDRKKYYLVKDTTIREMPVGVPVEVDKDAAKYLKGITMKDAKGKPTPRFKIEVEKNTEG